MTVQEKNSLGLKAAIAMAPGMVIGAYMIGHLIDFCGLKKATYFIIAITMVEYGLLAVFNEIHVFYFWAACLTSFGIGMVDGIVTNYINVCTE